MTNHAGVVEKLVETYGGRETVAALLGTSGTAVYFWQYRDKIPEQFHGKILILGLIDEEDLIPDCERIKRFAKMIRGAVSIKHKA